jgi:hypothetical protein
MTFQRAYNWLTTPFPTRCQRAYDADLFLATAFQLPSPAYPIPLSARALPFGRTARRAWAAPDRGLLLCRSKHQDRIHHHPQIFYPAGSFSE